MLCFSASGANIVLYVAMKYYNDLVTVAVEFTFGAGFLDPFLAYSICRTP